MCVTPNLTGVLLLLLKWAETRTRAHAITVFLRALVLAIAQRSPRAFQWNIPRMLTHASTHTSGAVYIVFVMCSMRRSSALYGLNSHTRARHTPSTTTKRERATYSAAATVCVAYAHVQTFYLLSTDSRRSIARDRGHRNSQNVAQRCRCVVGRQFLYANAVFCAVHCVLGVFVSTFVVDVDRWRRIVYGAHFHRRRHRPTERMVQCFWRQCVGAIGQCMSQPEPLIANQPVSFNVAQSNQGSRVLTIFIVRAQLSYYFICLQSRVVVCVCVNAVLCV